MVNNVLAKTWINIVHFPFVAGGVIIGSGIAVALEEG
jgi:hypothetical protein